ncbi:helix-turn-helix transcriptional regulator [Rhizobium leguminosarum]|uniref:helix-turn-helix transcriptional regulator n=1 Tax=Rhizobium TaxID=379 RepID=UPI00140F8674|nr:helix-turn-helix transcriptional regulator [Rhizobium leguminosarum]QIO67484.1 helix-turn-helix transcriptional regulator [Rhizobium leguminosarum bv. trifolii]
MRPDPIAYPPRGMSREQAARYIGVSTTKLDEMVKDRRMPKPKRIDGRVVWDRFALDAAFSELDENNVNRIDQILARSQNAFDLADMDD